MVAHLSDYHAAGMDFVPIVVETLGACLRMPSLPLGAIGKAISKHANYIALTIRTSQLIHHLYSYMYLFVTGECTPLAPSASHPPSSSGRHHLTP